MAPKKEQGEAKGRQSMMKRPARRQPVAPSSSDSEDEGVIRGPFWSSWRPWNRHGSSPLEVQ